MDIIRIGYMLYLYLWDFCKSKQEIIVIFQLINFIIQDLCFDGNKLL